MNILILYILIRLSSPWWTYIIWFLATSWRVYEDGCGVYGRR